MGGELGVGEGCWEAPELSISPRGHFLTRQTQAPLSEAGNPLGHSTPGLLCDLRKLLCLSGPVSLLRKRMEGEAMWLVGPDLHLPLALCTFHGA